MRRGSYSTFRVLTYMLPHLIDPKLRRPTLHNAMYSKLPRQWNGSGAGSLVFKVREDSTFQTLLLMVIQM